MFRIFEFGEGSAIRLTANLRAVLQGLEAAEDALSIWTREAQHALSSLVARVEKPARFQFPAPLLSRVLS